MNNQELEDLQIRLAFQEDLIETLDSRIADQQSQIDTMSIQLQHLHQKLKDIGSAGDAGIAAQDAPPPHY